MKGISTGLNSEQPAPTSSLVSTSSFVSELIDQHPLNQTFDAHRILGDHPEIKNYRSLVLDLVYEEYCRRIENGEGVRQASFAAKFPLYEESVLKLFQVHQHLEQPEFRPVQWPRVGNSLGNYHLKETIGRGSFARVYLAQQKNVANRIVVLKVTRHPFNEIEALGRLDHPNIVPVFTVESFENGLTAICMPLISRVTLFDVICELHSQIPLQCQCGSFTGALEKCHSKFSDDGPSQTPTTHFGKKDLESVTIKVGIDIAQALQYAHSKGVLHCDVKPTNILITANADAMLFDFNLASSSDGTAGRLGGTLPYMSPEQLRAYLGNDANFMANAGVDFFALGATLYQMATGRLPFGNLPEGITGKKAAAVLLQRQSKNIGFPKNSEGLGRRLKSTIRRCLAQRAEDRPASAEQFCSELTKNQALPRRSRRWFISRTALAATCTTAIVSGFYYGRSYLSPNPRTRTISLLQEARNWQHEDPWESIRLFKLAAEISGFDPGLQLQAHAHLAVALARRTAKHQVVHQLDLIRKLAHLDQNLAWSVELACLANLNNRQTEDLQRGEQVFQDLKEHYGNPSPDNQNNYHVMRVLLEKKDPQIDLRPRMEAFQSILDRNPNHPEAAYNVFVLKKLLQQRGRMGKPVDPGLLKICLNENGDRPAYVVHFVEWARKDIQADSGKSVDNFVYWMRKFKIAGGTVSEIQNQIQRIPNPIQQDVLSKLSDLAYKTTPVDRLVYSGIASPLDDWQP